MDPQFDPNSRPLDAPPPLRALSQYVKELSFRNFMGAAAGQVYDGQPAIDMSVEVKSRPIGAEGEAVEVDLRIDVQAKRGDMQMFTINLVYSGLFQLSNVSQDQAEQLIWVECPRLLFPFNRQIIAEVTREGGYPPLLISPIDFAPLYHSEQRARLEREAGQPDPSIPLA
jgi:preprotein translocase subunit SecB